MTEYKPMLRYIFLAVALLCFGNSFAQLMNPQVLEKSFLQHRDSSFQEKLFVHTDRNSYLTGEMCWFRIFLVDATHHGASAVSKVAYIELFDMAGKAVVQSKVRIDAGSGEGTLFLPATLGSGHYILRAYTQWMRNSSAAFFFQKQITIINPFIRPEYHGPNTGPKPTVDFFPEGGDIVNGFPTKVAFKVSNAVPDEPCSILLVSEGDTVEAKPFRNGLGHLTFTPNSAGTTKAYLKINGILQEINFPQIRPSGYAMQLTEGPGELVTVQVRSRSDDGQRGGMAFLFVHARNIKAHAELRSLPNGQTTFQIDRKKIPDGVSHFTVFDDVMKPVCERLYFKRPHASLQLGVRSDQDSYGTRRKAAIEISSAKKSMPVSADVSMSIYRIDSLSDPGTRNILSYFYLESDLAGAVEDPAFYFSEEPDAARAADDLMLTQGWRRFKWEKVQGNKIDNKFLPEYRSHLVTARVSRLDGTPVRGISTYLAAPGKLVNLYTARSDSDGHVQFEVRDFWGQLKLIVQANSTLDSAFSISINDPYHTEDIPMSSAPLKLVPSMRKELNRRSVSMQVHDIYFRDQFDRIVATKTDSTAFFGRPDETYNLDDYTRFPVMEEVMREYVQAVLVRKRKDGFHFLVIDKSRNGILPEDPLILLDGVPVFDVNKIMAFAPLKVKRLEVVARQFYVGPITIPGIVSYSTYSGDMGGFELDPRSVSIDYEGIQLQREFYAPRYENQKDRASRLPDQRYLLHWDPQVRTDDAGKATVEFYTSDVTGTYMVETNGLATEGAAGSSVTTFTVKSADF